LRPGDGLRDYRVSVRAALLAPLIAVAAIVGAPAQAAPPAAVEQLEVSPQTLEVGSDRDVVPVEVYKTAQPGRLRVSNPNDQWVRFLWGTFRRAQPDGRKRIEAYQSVVIRVRRERIDWIALLEGYQVAGQGSVRGIKL
jgi:hypothetical protein